MTFMEKYAKWPARPKCPPPRILTERKKKGGNRQQYSDFAIWVSFHLPPPKKKNKNLPV